MFHLLTSYTLFGYGWMNLSEGTWIKKQPLGLRHPPSLSFFTMCTLFLWEDTASALCLLWNNIIKHKFILTHAPCKKNVSWYDVGFFKLDLNPGANFKTDLRMVKKSRIHLQTIIMPFCLQELTVITNKLLQSEVFSFSGASSFRVCVLRPIMSSEVSQTSLSSNEKLLLSAAFFFCVSKISQTCQITRLQMMLRWILCRWWRCSFLLPSFMFYSSSMYVRISVNKPAHRTSQTSWGYDIAAINL